jgi:hypothetical protein
VTFAATAPLALTVAQGAGSIPGSEYPYVGPATYGYVFVDQGTQHVLFLGQDYHIHELYWVGNLWHHNDLTMLTGGASGLSGGLGGSAYIPTLPLTYGYAFET